MVTPVVVLAVTKVVVIQAADLVVAVALTLEAVRIPNLVQVKGLVVQVMDKVQAKALVKV